MDDTFEVIATARGAKPTGIVEPGTRFPITLEAYSENWMKPATATERRKMERLQKRAAGEPDDEDEGKGTA